MYTSFVGACLMGVALSLQLRDGIEMPSVTTHSDILAQTVTFEEDAEAA